MKALFLQLDFQVLAPETFCTFSQTPHIYISQKAPESYNFSIRYLGGKEKEGGKEERGERESFHLLYAFANVCNPGAT